MKIPVIRELAQKYTTAELTEAGDAFENERKNTLEVAGEDEGEILTNLLVAAVIRSKMDSGLSLQDALREHSKSLQGLLSKAK